MWRHGSIPPQSRAARLPVAPSCLGRRLWSRARGSFSAGRCPPQAPLGGLGAVLTLSLPPRPPDLPRDPALGDDGEAATSKPTLPDLSPDEPSEALGFPTLEEEEEEEGLGEARGPPSPARSSAVASPEPAPAPGAEEASSPTAEEGAAADPGSDGSPGKSPSKKKKKFRTPSFLKKSKKRSDC